MRKRSSCDLRSSIVILSLPLLIQCGKKEDVPPVIQDQSAQTTQAQNAQEQIATRPLVIGGLYPAKAKVGQTFNAQPNGRSALGIKCENHSRSTAIYFDGSPLPTTYGEQFISALVPPEVLTRAGSHTVYLKDRDRKSETVSFVVEP